MEKWLHFYRNKREKNAYMKVIYIQRYNHNLKSFAQKKEIEKAKGIYEDIRNVFPEDHFYSEEMIDELKDQEYENNLLQEALKSGPNEVNIDPENFSETFLLISDAISYGKNLMIGYFTYDTGVYIERSIRPEYIYHAKTTNNNVLVSWCYDWDDYRAFILDNIVFAKEINDNLTGEEEQYET